MSLAEQRIDMQSRIADQDCAVANRIAPGVEQEAGGTNFPHQTRIREEFAEGGGLAEVTEEIRRQIGPEVAHFARIEGNRRNDEIIVASAGEAGGSGLVSNSVISTSSSFARGTPSKYA